MKRNQVTAILLSVIMTVSACMPGNVISALAAENAGTQSTEAAAAVEEPAEETQAPAQEETDAESLPGSGEEAAEQEEDAPEADAPEADAPEADAPEAVDSEAVDSEAEEKDEADASDDTADDVDASDEAEDADVPEDEEQEVSEVKGAKDGSDIGTDEHYFYVDGDEYQDIDATYGEELTLEVYAEASDGEITFAWFYDYTDESLNCTQSSYTFTPNETLDDVIFIRCDITNRDDVASRHFRVSVIPYENHLVVQPENEIYEGAGYADLYVNAGDAVTLRVIASADDESQLRYVWKYYDENALDEWENHGAYVTVEGADTAECVTSPVTERLEYRCHVTDQYGNSEWAHFYVRADNQLELQPEDGEQDFYVTAGGLVTLRTTVSALDTSQLQYTWQKYVEYTADDGEYGEQYITIEGKRQGNTQLLL